LTARWWNSVAAFGSGGRFHVKPRRSNRNAVAQQPRVRSMTKLTKCFAQLAARAARDPSGTISVMAAISLTAIIGFAGLGTEASYWYVQKRHMQSAADSASFTAVADMKAGDT